MSLGMRVLRGPDWDQNEADGGEGHLGTVVGVKAEEGTAEVVWDNGQVTTCSVGKEGKHDLRILDNAQAGVGHSGHGCGGCGKSCILGMRWSCATCTSSLHLCTLCYVTGLHDLSHDFRRVTRHGDEGVPVGRRSGARKLRVVGIFPGARVSRGRDWLAANADGGAGGVGTVVEVVSPESGSARNAVRVSWDSGQSVQHRLGLHGKVDLVLVKESPAAPPVYLDHLPVLEVPGVQGKEEKEREIRVGDKVEVGVDEDTFRQIQTQSCGWSVGMTKCRKRIGVVKAFSEKGDIDVDFGGQKWRISPIALKKSSSSFSIGDRVRVLNDLERVRQLQDRHGGWVDPMKSCLGKVGRVQKLSRNGDLTVLFGTQEWHLNSLCCQPVQESPETDPQEDRRGPRGGLRQQLAELLGSQLPGELAGLPTRGGGRQNYDPAHFNKLFKAIVVGDVGKITAILDREPESLNLAVQGVTPLHLAAYNGETEVARLLVERGADMERGDSEGDTPLLLAVSRGHLEVTRLLLERSADVNASNEDGRTSLHKAASRGRADFCRLLLQHGASTNRKDTKGDTPLFAALHKSDQLDVIDLLMTSPDVDLQARNLKTFCILHLACYEGRTRCAEAIVRRDGSLVHAVMESEGWLPIHVAATNGHAEIVRMLIQAGSSVNCGNHVSITPLHAACVKGFGDIVKILLDNGADINAQDNGRMTALHRALWFSDSSREDNEMMRVETAKFLIQQGANPNLLNRRGQTAIEMAEPRIREQMMDFLIQHEKEKRNPASAAGEEISNESSRKPQNPTGGQAGTGMASCLGCSQADACIIFLPCADKVACLKCADAYHACPKCNKEITVKIDTAGKKLTGPS